MYKIKYLWNISINPIQTWPFFLHATGREASESPLYNFKTAHSTATKISNTNVLIISNFWA